MLNAFNSFWSMPISLGVVALAALIALWKIPQLQVGRIRSLNSKERFDRVNEARKTLAQIVGGLVLLAGFFGTWQSMRVAQENMRVAEEALSISQEGQLTDRFSKAIEQLGAVDSNGKKKVEVRLGGVYALERISSESKRDHWPIIEVLSTYVRQNTPRDISGRKPQSKLDADIQAILTVLGRRDRSFEIRLQRSDLHGSCIQKADLSGLDFDDADVDRADLGEADLRSAYFRNAVLIRANLKGASLDKTDFSGAELNAAVLDDASLTYTDFTNADLSLASLRGTEAKKADFKDANLHLADLGGANLRFARNLTQKQIDVALGNRNTLLPDDLSAPARWKQKGTSDSESF